MIKIELIDGYLDISKEFPISLNYNVDDFRNIQSKNTNYSKTITLPGTKNNNYQLGMLCDINSDFSKFNPNIKTDCKIILDDSSVVMDGYFQLKSIKKEYSSDLQGNVILYDIIIFDKVNNFFADIKDKLLTELDFSNYDHPYTITSITASWTNTYEDVYTYPLLYKGSNSYKTSDFKPAIFHKAYLKKIATTAGYSLSGSFMDRDDYSHEIIPFNGVLKELSQTEIDRRKFRAGANSTDTLYSKRFSVTQNFDSTQQNLLSLDDDTTSPNYDTNNHWNTTTNKWTVDRNGRYDLLGAIYLDTEWTTNIPILGVTNDGGEAVFDIGYIGSGYNGYAAGARVTISGTTNYDGTFDVKYNGEGSFKLFGVSYVANETGNVHSNPKQAIDFGFQKFNNTPFNYRIQIQLFKNGVYWYTFSQDQSVPYTDDVFNSGNGYTVNHSHLVPINILNQQLNSNDEITLRYRVYTTDTTYTLGYYTGEFNDQNAFNYYARTAVKMSTDLSSTSWIANDVIPTTLQDGDTVFLNDFIAGGSKGIKQEDLFIDLIKRYNLYIIANGKQLILHTRDDYYNLGGILDWTDKKDYNSEDKIELLTELQNKKVVFTYSEDDDDFNKAYTEDSLENEIYGQHSIIFDNEFISSEDEVSTPFSPTPLVYNSLSKRMIVPSISSTSDGDNIRVLYYGGLLSNLPVDNNYWLFNWYNPSTGYNVNTYMYSWPYAGHYDHPINPTISISYGLPQFELYERNQTTNATLYNRFWKNQMEQINTGKMVTSRFYLSPVDIQFIRDNLNTSIFVKDSYYLINKIKDYNPLVYGLTTVELLKVDRPTPFVENITVIGDVIGYGETSRTSGPPAVSGGVDNTSDLSTIIFMGDNNYVGVESDEIIIIGDDNVISDSSHRVGILGGSRNQMLPGLENSWIIGADDKLITESNEIWVGNLHIINGALIQDWNILDGGQDMTFHPYPTVTFNVLDGGQDTIREYNINNQIKIVDGGVD